MTMLHITNFGPIKEVTLDLSKSTVLIGPNSSGKSFVGLLTYFVLNPINNGSEFSNNPSDIINDSVNNLRNNPKYGYFKEKFDKYYVQKPNFKSEPLVFTFNEFEELCNIGLGQTFIKLAENKLKSIFGVNDLDILIKKDKNSFKLTYDDISFIKETNKSLNILNLSKILLNSYSRFFKIEEKNNSCELNLDYSSFEDNGFVYGNAFLEFYSFLASLFFKKFSNDDSYYVPSARDELIKNRNSFLSSLLRGNFQISVIQRKLTTDLVDLDNNPPKGEYYDLASKIEKDLLGGELIIEYDEPNNNFYFYDAEEDFKLPFAIVSSSIRELAPFIFYLKHILKKGDTIIMEEPEAHLHPKNQIKLIRYIIECINSGLNIMITSHSDYILDELNNLVRLNGVSKEKILEKFNDYSPLNSIDFNKLNIYHFIKESKYEVMPKSVNINETGFYEDNFSEISDELYDNTLDIIKTSKEE